MSMSLFKQMELVFAVRPQERVGEQIDLHAPVVNLAPAGYSGFFWTFFFLTRAGGERYRATKAIPWADGCVACGGQRRVAVPCRRLRAFGPLVWKGTTLCSNVPYCDLHARDETHLAMSVNYTGNLVEVGVIARREEFLRRTLLEVQNDGEHEPPWVTFPGALPRIGWNQGTNEAWLQRAFAPFWHTCSATEREEYLSRWSAPRDWVDWLLSWR